MDRDLYRAEDTGEGAWTVFANEPQRTAAGAPHHGGRTVEVFIGETAQEVAETACRILNEEGARSLVEAEGMAQVAEHAAETTPWHESLDPHQFCIVKGPHTLRDPDTDDWRAELTYSFAGREYQIGGEDTTEKKALLRMFDSLKASLEARHMVA